MTIWNKTEANPLHQSTDDKNWSTAGWANFYAGVLPGIASSATSILETLYAENPALPPESNTDTPPYEVLFTQFWDKSKYNLMFPWVKELKIKIRANTAVRYAMAAYANKIQRGADDPTQDLIITVSGVPPIVQNILFDPSFSAYYEGCADASIEGTRVGFSWIEHMVK